MRPLTPYLFAGVLSLASLRALCAADSVPPPQPAPSPANAVVPAADGATPPQADQTPASAPDSVATTSDSQAQPSSPPAPSETASAPESVPIEKQAAVEEAPQSAAPQIVTARIDPELALRLSLLEKTMLAQTTGQNQIYTETTRLLMFFGTACVAMGLIAMVAAVFLMNRTLASVSAITAQVAQPHSPHALPGAAAMIPTAAPSASGFEKVQASGQRFQNRMTSLEQRLEELEHLAGHAPSVTPAADGASTDAAPVVEVSAAETTPPKRIIPVSAILVRKAETLMNLGKLGEAMTTLDEAAQHEGDPSEVHLARGRVLEKLGRLGDALHSYDMAATSDGSNTAALLMKAGVLNRQERFDEALSCYERALAVHRASN